MFATKTVPDVEERAFPRAGGVVMSSSEGPHIELLGPWMGYSCQGWSSGLGIGVVREPVSELRF